MMIKRNPVWAAIAAVLVVGGIAAVLTGAWAAPLRAVGLIAPPQVEVDYINVGDMGPDQDGVVGDSILLRSSEGAQVLIDGGYPNGLALEFLKANQIDHLDMIVLSHAHDDHTGGLIAILKEIPVDVLVHNGQTLDSAVYAEFQEAIKSSGVKTRVVKSGDKLPFGSLEFQVLGPRKINPDSVNNNSIVLRLVVGQVKFLFTGDLQHLEEERLLAVDAPIDVDILKIAHHGADTSSKAAFLEKVSPEVAIYSVGSHNMYDFPHRVTLENLHSMGAVIYGTDINGTVVVTTDGKRYEVILDHGEPWQP